MSRGISTSVKRRRWVPRPSTASLKATWARSLKACINSTWTAHARGRRCGAVRRVVGWGVFRAGGRGPRRGGVSGGACAGAAGPAPGDVRGGRASPGGLKAGGPACVGGHMRSGRPAWGPPHVEIRGDVHAVCGVSGVYGGETFKY